MARVKAETLRSVALTSLSGTYTAVGSALTHPLKVSKLTNNTGSDLILSTDGVTDNFFMPMGSFTLYDLSANSPPVEVNDNFVLPIGTRLYAKISSDAPSLYFEGLYAEGGE